MLGNFAITVMLGSIFIVFLQEFKSIFKKIKAIPGMELIFPLLVVSWIVEKYEDWNYWLLASGQFFTTQLIANITEYLPFKWHAIYFIRIFLLLLLAIIPAAILSFIVYKKGRFEPWPFIYRLSLVLWVIVSVFNVI